jgi:hypothetical protein
LSGVLPGIVFPLGRRAGWAVAGRSPRLAAQILDPISSRGQCALLGLRGTEEADQRIKPVRRRKYAASKILADTCVRPPGLVG